MLSVEFIKYIPFASFALLLLLQTLFPRRLAIPIASVQSGKPNQPSWQRVGHNLLLFVFNTVLIRFAVPLSLLAVSLWASERGFGLMNMVPIADWLAVLICVVLLDFAIYWQHVATHHWPILWRMHKIHHADTNMDVTTAIRFHPLELLLSLVFKSVMVVILGAPALAVIIFELLLFVGSAFNHSNLKLPIKLDTFLRLFIATPDTHRSHHSTLVHEQNTNYGFFLIWWDKLFGTYTQEPTGGHEAMAIGLLADDDQCPTVGKMLLAPFK